jgi:hypothetical protein
MYVKQGYERGNTYTYLDSSMYITGSETFSEADLSLLDAVWTGGSLEGHNTVKTSKRDLELNEVRHLYNEGIFSGFLIGI